jgi:hypothetical protein
VVVNRHHRPICLFRVPIHQPPPPKNNAHRKTAAPEANPTGLAPEALFIWLIIRFIQLVFLTRTVFFSHKKSTNSVFQPAYNSSRTAPCITQTEGNTFLVFHFLIKL